MRLRLKEFRQDMALSVAQMSKKLESQLTHYIYMNVEAIHLLNKLKPSQRPMTSTQHGC